VNILPAEFLDLLNEVILDGFFGNFDRHRVTSLAVWCCTQLLWLQSETQAQVHRIK
jgi:hypothetical protein